MPTFDDLKASYTELWSRMQIRPDKAAAVDKIAKKLIAHKDEYEAVEAETGVPWFVIAGLHNRESDAKFDTYLGNGEPFNRITRLVPKGRGPFSSWQEGAVDALSLGGLDKVKDWTPERACYEIEKFNGFGYRNKGLPSPYLWSFTNNYTRGKYVSDGHFDSSAVDQQCGAMPIVKRIMELEGLSFGQKNPIKTPATVAITGGILATLASYFDASPGVVIAIVCGAVALAGISFVIARAKSRAGV